MMTLDELQEAAMELEEPDRLALAEHLVASVPFEPHVQQAWIEEALRRDARLQSGEDPGLTPEEFWSDDKP
jgi:hypothetical protein